MPLLIVFAVLLGTAIGSFLNVVIWRVPQGLSVIAPPSACPTCGHEIRHRDNVPILGWALLRGKCRDCQAKISVRYPLVEALTGALFGLMAVRIGLHAELVAFLYLVAIGVALALIDIDIKRLPDVLTLPSYPVAAVLLGLAAVLDAGFDPLVRAGVAGLAVFLLYFALWFVYPAGMGFGDVKLSGVIGLYLGWISFGATFVGVFAGFLFGGFFGIGVIVLARGGRKTKVPFGPFMLAGALAGILVGDRIAEAYLSFALG